MPPAPNPEGDLSRILINDGMKKRGLDRSLTCLKRRASADTRL